MENERGYMKNEIEKKKPMTPGFGIAGQVMCPFSFMAPKICNREGCELWVELAYNVGKEDETKVARCAIAWIPFLSTEIRATIEKMAPKK